MPSMFKKHTFTSSRSSTKFKQDKSKENHTQIYHTQIAEKKKRKS